MRTGAIYLLLFVIGAVVTACSAPDTPTPAPEATTSAPAPAGDSIFQMIKPDGTAVEFTVDKLRVLPLKTIFSDGSPEEGPMLLDVIKATEITDYREVTLTGSDGSYTFAREAVTPEVVLDFNNRGGVKLASPDLARDRWVRDIFKIEVK